VIEPHPDDSPIRGGALTEPQLDAIAHYVEERLVSRQVRGDLMVLCYTPKCAHEKYWTPLTRACRGLVLDFSGKVVARPFDKFFNLGEVPETQFGALPRGEPSIVDKVDGSLGIIFWHGNARRWDVCTKGSFDSPQATYARERLLPRLNLIGVPRRLTLLAEIVFPGNRIVVDYEGAEGLVLLGARAGDTGQEVEPLDEWMAHMELAQTGFNFPARFAVPHLGIAHLRHRPNAEGYVLRWPGGFRVKVKSEWYLKVHRMLDRRNPRAVLDMVEDGTAESVEAQLPPLLAGEFRTIRGDLERRIVGLLAQATQLSGEALVAVTNEGYDAARGLRGEFARAMIRIAPGRRDLHSIVWAAFDGKDDRAAAIKALRKELEA
jgi:putative RNA ligase